ncbi:MAG: hypothetical protein ABEH38_02530 [Flavobacteriales bacterium]
MSSLPFFPLFLLFLLALPNGAKSQEGNREGPKNNGAPVNLHEAGLEKLQRRAALSRIHSIRLLEYRRVHGPIRTFYELHYLEGFTLARIQQLKRNAYIPDRPSSDSIGLLKALRNTKGRFRIRWGRIIQERRGYKNGTYQGPPSSLKGQCRIQIPDLARMGVSLEKDAGESWLKKDKGEPQAHSTFLTIQEKPPLQKAVLGPLVTSSGGGLLIDNGSAFLNAPGAESGRPFTLEAHSGSPDRNSLKGVGASFAHRGYQAGFIYSSKKWTARMDSTRQGKSRLRTLYRNGLHRRSSRIRKRGNWERQDLIGHLAWEGKGLSFSTTFYQGSASHPPSPSSRIRGLPSDQEQEEKGAEIHARGGKEAIRWSGSIASEGDGAQAFILAFSAKPYSDLSLSAQLEGAEWGFDPFWSPIARDGRPFIRSSMTGSRVLGPGWQLELRSEILHRAWAFYGRKGGGTDKEMEMTITRTAGMKRSIEGEIAYESKERDRRKKELKALSPRKEKRIDISLKASCPLTRDQKSRFRLKASRSFLPSIKDGLLLAHDLVSTWDEAGAKLYWRLAFFEAPSYPTRLYSYENDLLYAFSVRPYYRSGIRSYLLIRYELSKDITLEGKLGSWSYRELKDGTIGSGPGAISGYFRNRVRLQLRGSF